MSKRKILVEVYKATGEMEAQVVKGLLESYGIPCLLKPNVALPRPYSPVMNIGEVRIMVWDSEVERARELIKGDANV